MDIREKINKQLSAGFSDADIYSNLLKDGHSKEEIDKELAVAVKEVKRANQTSTKGLVFGFAFLVIVLFRIVRFSNSSGTGAIIAFISIITGIILMLFWFSNKRG